MYLSRLVVATGALFTLSVVTAFGVDAYLSRQERLDTAQRELTQSGAVLSERVRQMLQAADRSLAAAAIAHRTFRKEDRVGRDGHRILRAIADASDVLADIAWIENDGVRHVTSLRPEIVPMDVSQRDFYRAHIANGDRGIFIGRPERASLDGRWIMPVSRRMTDERNEFSGVAVGTLDAKYVTSVLERFHTSNGAAYGIILKEGQFLARAPSASGRTGDSALQTALFKEHLPKAPEGSYSARSVSGGEERMYNYRTVPNHPLVIVVSFARSAVLAPWHDRIRVTGGLALLACIGAAAATWLIFLQTRRLRRERLRTHAALVRAEHASRSKSEFLAHMSHELRTPMNAVLGFTEMMTREVFGPVGSPKYREYLNDIAMSGQHLLQVVNNILDLAKVEAGKWEMEEEEIDLRELCESTMQMIRERARSAGISIAIDSTVPQTRVRGDRRLLRQILINLLTNGIKFTERGGKVSLKWRVQPDGAAEWAVTDTGAGMTEEDCRRVLEPFGRGSAELARARHDTGLGLSICRQFAEMHGGRLVIASRLGYGTTVSIMLPAARVVTRLPQAAAA